MLAAKSPARPIPAAEHVEVAELCRNFDVHDPRLNARLYETLEHLRRRGPVHYSEAHGGHWVVVGHREVAEAARDWRHFSSAGGVVLAGTKPQKYVPVELDPPEHQAFRRLLNPHFSKQAAASYEPELTRFADELIDRFVGKGSADLADAYAKPLAAHFFFDLFFGLSPEDASGCEAATNQAMFSSSVDDQIEGFGRLERLVQTLVENRRGRPSDGGFIDAIRTGEVDGRLVSEEELIGIIQLMIVGGDDTAVHTIGNVLLELGRHPEIRDRLAADPSLMPAVLEETIRHMPPAVSIARTVAADVILGGEQLRAGDRVVLLWSSANRDESVFDDAGTFRLGRENMKQHIAFGGGVHKCIGEWFARTIVTVAVERILARIPEFVVPEGAEIAYRTGQSRGPTAVPALFPAPGPNS